MSELIANTVFGTGPDDNVAAVDVYKPQPSAPKNNGVTSVGKEIGKNLSGTFASATDKSKLKELISFQPGDTIADKKAALDKLKQTIPTVSDLKEKTLGPILGKLGFDPKIAAGLTKESAVALAKSKGVAISEDLIKQHTGMGDVRVLVGDVEHIRKDIGDIDSAQDVMNVLGKITGNSSLGKITVIKDELAALSGIMAMANKLRIPEAIDAIMGRLSSDKEKRELVLSNLRQALIDCDLYAIGKALDYAGGAGVLARVPDAIILLVACYRLPSGVSAPTNAARDQLIAILNRIDPNWAIYKRNGTNVTNLEVFTYANEVCLSVLELNTSYKVACMMAKTYPSVSLLQKAKEYHPLAAVDAR